MTTFDYMRGFRGVIGAEHCARYESLVRGNADVMEDISARLKALEGARPKEYIAGVHQIRADFGDFLKENRANLDLVVLFMAGNGYIAEEQGTRAMAVSIAEKGDSLDSGIEFLERWDTPSEISPFTNRAISLTVKRIIDP